MVDVWSIIRVELCNGTFEYESKECGEDLNRNTQYKQIKEFKNTDGGGVCHVHDGATVAPGTVRRNSSMLPAVRTVHLIHLFTPLLQSGTKITTSKTNIEDNNL